MNLPDKWKCSECDEYALYKSHGQTLVGYLSSPEHDHDDNCADVRYICSNNHTTHIIPRRKCPNKSCDWKGKEECFCHKGKKQEW